MIDVEYADRVQREEIHFQSLRREIVAIFKLKNPKTCDKISSESEKNCDLMMTLKVTAAAAHSE